MLMTEKAGKVMGFEKLNFTLAKTKHLQVAFEIITT